MLYKLSVDEGRVSALKTQTQTTAQTKLQVLDLNLTD
jgi:hypothetical protein